MFLNVGYIARGMGWLIHVYTRSLWSISLGHSTVEVWTSAVALVASRSLLCEVWMTCLCNKLYRYVGGSIQGKMLTVGPWSDGMIVSTSLDFFFFLVLSLHSLGFPVVSVILSKPSDNLKYERFIISHLLRKMGSCIVHCMVFVKQKVTFLMYLFPDIYRRQFPWVGKLEQRRGRTSI